MKVSTSRTLLAMMCSLCFALTSWGADFVSGGLKYSVNNNGSGVTVVANTEKYSGDIVVPATVTNGGQTYKVQAIGNSAFSGCNDLTSITISEGLESIGSFAFYNCKSFANVVLPASVRTVNSRAFINCTDIVSITLNEDLESIGSFAFENCVKLKKLTIPNSVTSLGERLCLGCSALTKVEIGDGLKEIPYRAFYELASLETVKPGSSVNNIASEAFSGCNYITTIICFNTRPAAWGNLNNTFSSGIYFTCDLYVPAGTTDTYKAADGWKNFFNIKEGIPTAVSKVAVQGSARAYVQGGNIVAEGGAEGTPVNVYSTSGQLVSASAATSGITRLDVQAQGVYIVKVGNATFKVRL